MKANTRTLTLTVVTLAASEVAIFDPSLPTWGRVALGTVAAGTAVASAYQSMQTDARLDTALAQLAMPFTDRLRREEEDLAMRKVLQRPDPDADESIAA